LCLLGLGLAFCLPLRAMDRWAALSQIESGDNDAAIGAAGEVSRYQMKPELWRLYAPAGASCEKAKDSLAVAQEVMKDRCSDFEKDFHRPPTDFEFYVLWNAPAQIQTPSSTVRERANRFCNLVADVSAAPRRAEHQALAAKPAAN
jgi:hypothetical protein